MLPNPRAPASFEEARAAVLAAARPLGPPDAVAIAEAAARVLAEDVASVADVPGFDNSGMDGYAVRTEDVAGASTEAPRRLRVVGDLPAGRAPREAVGPGEAIRIMTGAPIPDGADQVVEVERTAPAEGGAGGAASVLVLAAREPGANIRRAGEDLRRGTRALEAGVRLGPPEIGLLAACGRETVKVARRPLVAILSTGDEVVAPGAPEPLARGQVRDANQHSLAAAAVVACGARPLALGIARDDPGAIEAAVREGLGRGADALLTSAGISVGARDCAPDVFCGLGFAERFREVKIKPGRPFTFYVGEPGPGGGAGARPRPVFALPGNPVAALVCFELFVRPALLVMQGARALDRPEVVAVSDRALRARPGRINFVRARLRYDPEAIGGYRVAEVLPEGSGISRTMHQADALLRVDAPVAPGGRVRAILLHAQEVTP